MYKKTVLSTAAAFAFAAPLHAVGADSDLAEIRAQIKQLKESYESRIQSLEKRLEEAEARSAQVQLQAQVPVAPVSASVEPALPVPSSVSSPVSASGFNPAVALILAGTYASLSQDPRTYRIQGFFPPGDIGPGNRSFNLGESELTLSANIDPQFAGQLTFSLAADNSVSVEEAFFRTQGLSSGLNLKAGRFLSSIGYLNSQHAHTWDFVDAPLVYQAFLGGQYKPDGLQARWLAPTESFLEFGAEAGNGSTFPGNDRNRNGLGSGALFVHMGDDLGVSASWRAGVSFLRTGATDRSFSDTDSLGNTVDDAFTGKSNIWIADGIYKWAPNGNPYNTNFKLQGEYFRRTEKGTLTYDTQAQSLGTATGNYDAIQSGWYLQGVYQFRPLWRVGLRFDRLSSGSPSIGLIRSGALSAADFKSLESYRPSRGTLMFDYSPSEFSRFRLQLARDKSSSTGIDRVVFLQYIMSLGAHGAHTF